MNKNIFKKKNQNNNSENSISVITSNVGALHKNIELENNQQNNFEDENILIDSFADSLEYLSRTTPTTMPAWMD